MCIYEIKKAFTEGSKINLALEYTAYVLTHPCKYKIREIFKWTKWLTGFKFSFEKWSWKTQGLFTIAKGYVGVLWAPGGFGGKAPKDFG